MSKASKFSLIGAAGLLVAGALAFTAAHRRTPSVEVRLEKVTKRNLTSIVTASGKIEPKNKVDVSSEITGRIVALPVREGDLVQRGQVVVRIDPARYEATVQRLEASLAGARAAAMQAQANRDQAERAWNRARDIRAQNAQLVSQEALEQAETQRAIAIANNEAAQRQVDQARAALREAQDQLRKTTILAPMSGRITRLVVEQGEVAIQPGLGVYLLMTIWDPSVIQVKVKVDETDVVRIHNGDSTEVAIDAFPDTVFTGRVTEIRNSSVAGAATSSQQGASEQAVDYEVKVTLDRPPPGVRPDLSATARIVTAKRRGVLSVPIISLTVRQPEDTLRPDSARARRAAGRDRSPRTGGTASPASPATPGGRAASDSTSRRKREIEGLFVVDTTTMAARFRRVRVGIAGDEYFEVLGGVRENETIVAGPYQAIRDLKNDSRVRAARETGRGARGAQPARSQ